MHEGSGMIPTESSVVVSLATGQENIHSKIMKKLTHEKSKDFSLLEFNLGVVASSWRKKKCMVTCKIKEPGNQKLGRLF